MNILPIPIQSIVALVFVLGFSAWAVLWDDKKDEERIEREKVAVAAPDGDGIGKHVRKESVSE